MKQTAIAILASGSGTTAEAVVRHIVREEYDITVPLVICNNPTAGIFDRIKQLNRTYNLKIDTKLINSRTHPVKPDETLVPNHQTDAEQLAILDVLAAYNINVVVLMGFMKHIGPQIINTYGWRSDYTSIYQARMLNTHPGLLPATKGMFGVHVQEAVLAQHKPQAGHTVHIVSDEYDEGPTIFEHRVPVNVDDTPETLFARVQQTEKAHLAADIASFLASQQHYNEGGK